MAELAREFDVSPSTLRRDVEELARREHVVRGHGVSEKAVRQAVELSEEKYCSVAATLRPAAEIVSSYEIIEEEDGA